MKRSARNLSRRALVRNAGLAAGAGLLGLSQGKGLSQPQAAAGATGRPRILALIGDRHHNPDYIRVSLDPVFKELNISVDYTIEYDKISANMLRGYNIFLVLREGMNWSGGYLGPDAASGYSKNLENAAEHQDGPPVPWMTEEQGAAIKDFVNAGGGLYALHDSSDISHTCRTSRIDGRSF